MKTLGNSSALLRVEGRPVYYVYDSYRVSAQDWAALFDPQGASTVRGTALDGECVKRYTIQSKQSKNTEAVTLSIDDECVYLGPVGRTACGRCAKMSLIACSRSSIMCVAGFGMVQWQQGLWPPLARGMCH
jgi:hypothetical protein